MTFLAPSHTVDLRGASSFFGRKASKPKDRLRIADEDGARRALGPDGLPPAGGSRAASIEHLARIALG